VIDLHLHTTASDGLSSPDALVAEAAALGLRTIAVTDHDTVAAVEAVRRRATTAGIDVIAAIEVTAVLEGRDVHVLGYFVDIHDASLNEFLARQRADRRRRVFEIARRLDTLGAPVDTTALDREGETTGKSLGRPLVAAALVAAGHATDIPDAFDRYIGEGRPAYVERIGASPADVIARLVRAGGLAAFAHPGKFGRDDLIPALAEAGLAALEVFHPDHTDADAVRYRQLARTYGLAVTGGSDYHGPGSTRAWAFGRVTLPEDDFADLVSRRRTSPA
jgi:predicted metal-dependent phosphoesterase TrpH